MICPPILKSPYPSKAYIYIYVYKSFGRFGDFKIGGQIIHAVKYADDLVLLAKEEKVL